MNKLSPLPGEVLPPAEFDDSTYKCAVKRTYKDCSLRIKVLSPDSRYGTHIITGIDVLEMMDT